MPIDRRTFIAGMGGFGVGLGFGGLSHWLPFESPRTGPEWEPGEETFVSSTCLLCPAHCGIRGRLMDGRLVRLEGNPLHPVSAGGLCAKGVAGLQLLYHPSRLTGPVRRVGDRGSDEFEPVSWDEALEMIGTRLKELKDGGESQSLTIVAGSAPGLMGEMLDRFARAYGTPNLISEDDADGAAEVLKSCQGIDAQPAFDLSSSDYVLSFGVPLAEAWTGLPQASTARRAPVGQQPRWVQIDVRHSRTAAQADEWVAIRPGNWGLLALGLAHVILKEGMYDAGAARRNVRGLEDEKGPGGELIQGFRSLVAKYGRTSEVAEKTGVERETIVRLAKSLGLAKRPVAIWDHVVAWAEGGLSDALAIHALNILVGAIDRPGGVLVQPETPVPSLTKMSGADVPPMERDGSTATRMDWAARILDGSATVPDVALFYCSNPVASHPRRDEVVEAIGRIPLSVSFSPFLDETAKHADLVLPDCTYLERWQDAPAPPTVPIAVWGLVQPMVEPLHDTRASGDVLLDLAGRIGGEVAAALPFTSLEEIVTARGKSLASARRGGILTDELSRDEMRELEARGWWVSHGESDSEFWESLRESGGWFDPYYDYYDRSMFSRLADGRATLTPLNERRMSGLTGSGAQRAADDSEYPLLLIPYRILTMASGGTPLMPWLLENLSLLTGDAWKTWAEINPRTASSLGIRDGAPIVVESARGRFEAFARVFAGAQPGVVNVPYGLHSRVDGWGSVAGSNPLAAVGREVDAETGLPDWSSTRIRIVRS